MSLAVFDDRVEVWSTGALPTKVTAASLTRKHGSHPRNPFIADVFYGAGLIEKWGRGTNRVIEMCRRHGIAAPTFEEIAGSVLVTFRVKVGTTRVLESGTPQVTPLLKFGRDSGARRRWSATGSSLRMCAAGR